MTDERERAIQLNDDVGSKLTDMAVVLRNANSDELRFFTKWDWFITAYSGWGIDPEYEKLREGCHRRDG